MESELDGEKVWKKLKTFKKLYRVIDIVGNGALLIALFLHQWFIAFLLFVVFFPDEVEIIRFFKRLLNYRTGKNGI